MACDDHESEAEETSSGVKESSIDAVGCLTLAFLNRRWLSNCRNAMHIGRLRKPATLHMTAIQLLRSGNDFAHTWVARAVHAGRSGVDGRNGEWLWEPHLIALFLFVIIFELTADHLFILVFF